MSLARTRCTFLKCADMPQGVHSRSKIMQETAPLGTAGKVYPAGIVDQYLGTDVKA